MFFVFGSPRSGTTLLAQCLNSHPEIIVPHETNFIIPLAFVCARIPEPELGKDMIINLITRSPAFQTSIGEYLSAAQVAAIVNACEYRPALILNALYAGLAASVGKKFAGDKSPNDLLFLGPLVSGSVLEHASTKMIHIVRDIRDVMTSLNRLKWVANLDLYFPRAWNNSNLFLHTLYKDKKSAYFFLRYEDLVREPEAMLRRISDFLGVDFQQTMLDTQNFNPRYKDVAAHSKLYAPISANNIGVYKQELDSAQLASYEKQAREALEVFGYSAGQADLLSRLKARFAGPQKH